MLSAQHSHRHSQTWPTPTPPYAKCTSNNYPASPPDGGNPSDSGEHTSLSSELSELVLRLAEADHSEPKLNRDPHVN